MRAFAPFFHLYKMSNLRLVPSVPFFVSCTPVLIYEKSRSTLRVVSFVSSVVYY